MPGAPDYSFLTRPRWAAFAAVMVLLAGTMIGLGIWQLTRYSERSETNARIDAAADAEPVPVTEVLKVGARPSEKDLARRVTAQGWYDQAQEILVRGRTLDGRVGYEIVTPLILANGQALLVDRGWLPATGDATQRPEIPPASTGPATVEVVGRVRLPETRADPPARRDGWLEARRIDPAKIATVLPYQVLGGYVVLEAQSAGADPRLTPIQVTKENAGQNLAYVVQWWMFAAITLAGFGWLARRESRRAAVQPKPEVRDG